MDEDNFRQITFCKRTPLLPSAYHDDIADVFLTVAIGRFLVFNSFGRIVAVLMMKLLACTSVKTAQKLGMYRVVSLWGNMFLKFFVL